MNFIVDRIPGSFRIDPDAAGQDNQRKREKHRHGHRRDGADSVSISEEARRRCSEGNGAEPEELEEG